MVDASVLGPIRVLLVEDSEQDAMLIARELRRGGLASTIHRVETHAAMEAALDGGEWDVVLSDYSLPDLDAHGAYDVVRERGLDVPFIIVSGTVGEEAAVQAMQIGVNDYILKGKLARLVPAIERDVREARSRKARRATEQALLASETRFRRLAESGVIGIFVSDTAGRILEANDAFLRTMGHTREDLLAGRIDWLAMTPPEARAANDRAVALVGESGFAPPWETDAVRPDGVRVPLLLAVAKLDERETIAVALDLSERKQLEARLRQAQKMDAIGTLAGGVAHDFNNLMSVILSCTGLMLERVAEGDVLHPDLVEVQRAAERAADLTRQLLAFSRRQVLRPVVLDVREVLENMERMLRRVLRADIDLSLHFAAHAGTVRADPGQIEQVVLNLVVNARDAMPSGGKLTIETARVHLGADYASTHVEVTPGQYVMIAISDTGEGMDAATRARVFEPFFTTKELGKGTGLGLSTVYGIVRQTGGHIGVYSEPGRGTSFKVYLPCVAEGPATALSRPPAAAALTGTETILVVEDEAQVRAVLVSVLRRLGYTVLEAQNAGEALLVAEQLAGGIDLLLTDVVMPKMSGPELAARLVAARPSMKVLLMSGYPDAAAFNHGVGAAVPFLPKPFTPEVIAGKVRDVLEGRVPPAGA